MFKLKIVSCILFLIFLIFLKFQTIKADAEECNKILIEGGDRALKKIFNDFEDIKSIVRDLKTNDGVCQKCNKCVDNDLQFFDARVDQIPEHCHRTTLPKDCAAATVCTKRSGIYKIQVEQYSKEPFYVPCDDETENGDWLVIQRRQDGSVNFYRDWLEYEKGFGDIEGEFFIGLKKLHALTNYNGPQELLIVMEDVNATRAYAKYDAFAIGNETESYKLKRLGKYTGTAGNSFQRHIGMKFSTKDRDNDENPNGSCAVSYTGAWWYTYCHNSNLNGKYGDNTHGKGINWKTFRGHNVSLTYVKMMLRRSRNI
ncbi:ryncolin-1-like isoform X2 [Lucilia cuprina]|uniref:ryncolin-1-like isoform X2 n=1 Tax=Lucilia cuprina TaxID=7375 RepID=UPI001F05E86C|nr:ryncolin-1-like isoform X2 [Lucilia cuprina]